MRRIAMFISVLLATNVGCHDVAPDDVDADVNPVDTTPVDTNIADSVSDTAEPDGDVVAPDTTMVADTTPFEPEPGGLGWPCDTADDCNSQYCVEGWEGFVCSRTCETDCQNGWECGQHVGLLPDILFICQPPHPTLCRPCDANMGCLVAHDGTAHACIPAGDAGSFCGAVCETDSECPADYFCEAAIDISGNVVQQCQPDNGECTCSGSAVLAEATTTCAASSEIGTCQGQRGCSADGLSACDAPEAQVDLCNGLDDNCDGQIDEAFAPAACAVTNDAGSCPGFESCSDDGEVVCEGQVPEAEVCGDGVDNNCDGLIDDEGADGCRDYYFDADGDEYGVGEPRCLCEPDGAWSALGDGDCDDGSQTANPATVESCNGRDDNCNGDTDEPGASGCTLYFADADMDTFGDSSQVACLCAPAAPFVVRNDEDCDDGEALVSPAATETCDAVDNDCDGTTDEQNAVGCSLFFTDGDGDGAGDPASFQCLCAPSAPFVATFGGDCDDADADAGPGQAEACDGADNDCDGLIDEEGATGCTVYYRDNDGDGFGQIADSRCLCAPDATYNTEQAGDCDDSEADAFPGQTESCDGVDNDCDDLVDENGATGCVDRFEDRDQDGHGVASSSACVCTPEAPFNAILDDDCDDTNPFIKPGAAEACNGLDDDCNDQIDEGVAGQCSPFYKDADNDGWGDANDSQCLCTPSGQYTTTKPGDCNDNRNDVFPLAQELCNAIDDNCDGATDEQGATGCNFYFRDGDADTFGVAGDSACLCAPSAPYTATDDGDCNDGLSAVFPGATEVCNAIDDDCDGATNEAGSTGCTTYLRDTDGDNYGVALDSACLCAPDMTYRAPANQGGDCNDLDADISPGATEICDGADNDCNGVADDPNLAGCTTYYRDVDGDTFGDDNDSQCLCAPSGTYTATMAGDCDDLVGLANPSRTESCNGIDDDCDGVTDEQGAAGCANLLRDEDGDGFGVTGDTQCLCQPGPVYRAVLGGDCLDTDADVAPGKTEVCNGIDDDCNGGTDTDGAAGCAVVFRDDDNDGFGQTADSRCLCAAADPYDATQGGDCDDTSSAIKPGATESCNGDDDDCDGLVDEIGASGCTTYYLDTDGDGYGVAGQSLCLCAPLGAYGATQQPDCDDSNPLRTPGKPEICGDSIDNDCDNTVDEPNAVGCTDYWEDADDDTWGVDDSEMCLCLPTGDFTAIRGMDCDDASNAVGPEEDEVCDGIDNNCDGVVDEECGIATTGWPTFMQNNRRTGYGLNLNGPESVSLRWQRQIQAGVNFEGSPVIDDAGDVFVIFGDKLHKLAAATGNTIWTATLPEPAFARAAPTLRFGGTLVVPTGNGITMIAPDGSEIWHTDFGGAAGDIVNGTPVVDNNGKIYAVSNTHIRKLDEAGAIVWAVPITNTAAHPSDPALSPDGRIYFASPTQVYSINPAGSVNWTWSPPSGTIGSSVTLNELARIVVAAGTTVYVLSDALTQAAISDSQAFTGLTIPSHIGLYSDGWKCCNPQEFPVIAGQGTNAVKMLRSTLVTLWTASVTKATGPSAPAIIDREGGVFIGSNATTNGAGAVFRSLAQNSGGQQWSFTADGDDIDGAAALGNDVVVFGDSSGTIYMIEEN